MAKKKVTNQSNHHKQEEHPQPQRCTEPHRPTTMEDPSEKFQSLKNLNAMLLRETSERRQQVDSLVEAKEALESALNRSALGKKALEDQLSETTEDNVGLELQRGVVIDFLETQMREMGLGFNRLVAEKNEVLHAKTEREAEVMFLKGEMVKLNGSLENERSQLSKMSLERDTLSRDFDGLVAEANGLKEKVIELEKKEKNLREEVQKLRMEGERLMEEKDENDRVIEELTKERDLARRDSAGLAEVIEKLKGEIHGAVMEKNETEKQKSAQEQALVGLELEMKQLNEVIKNLRKEEASMRANILDLEGSLGQAIEKEKKMSMEMGGLLEGNKQKEQSIQMLTETKSGIEKVLDTVQRGLVDKQRQIEEMVRAKNEIQQVKFNQEGEIAELHKELDHLRDVMHKLKETCRDLEERNEELLSEVNHHRNAADKMMFERDDIKKGFAEEQNEVKKLMLQVSGMEEKIEQTAAELAQLRNEQDKLIKSNKLMENQVDTLKKEKDTLQKSLGEAKRESDDLRVKIEYSNQALTMLKNIAGLVRQSKNDIDNGEVAFKERKLEEEMLPYEEELDAIKNAFENKSKMVEDLKQELALMQKSVTEAHKRKSLLTVISSATTILAAAFAAYVANGR